MYNTGNMNITIERKKTDCSALPKGWQREEVMRKAGLSAGKVDVYYYSPAGKKIDSKSQLVRQLGDQFDVTSFDFQSGRYLYPSTSLSSQSSGSHHSHGTASAHGYHHGHNVSMPITMPLPGSSITAGTSGIGLNQSMGLHSHHSHNLHQQQSHQHHHHQRTSTMSHNMSAPLNLYKRSLPLAMHGISVTSIGGTKSSSTITLSSITQQLQQGCAGIGLASNGTSITMAPPTTPLPLGSSSSSGVTSTVISSPGQSSGASNVHFAQPAVPPLRHHPYEFSRGMRSDVSLVPPIRQTASIFKQPVTVYKTQEGKVKHELKHGIQEKPKQLFWEKRLERMNACDAAGHEFSAIDLPKVLRPVGPNVDEGTLLKSIATALHVSVQPVTGQMDGRTPIHANASVCVNPGQPLMLAVNINEDDIRRQEDRVRSARSKLQDALKV